MPFGWAELAVKTQGGARGGLFESCASLAVRALTQSQRSAAAANTALPLSLAPCQASPARGGCVVMLSLQDGKALCGQPHLVMPLTGTVVLAVP